MEKQFCVSRSQRRICLFRVWQHCLQGEWDMVGPWPKFLNIPTDQTQSTQTQIQESSSSMVWEVLNDLYIPNAGSAIPHTCPVCTVEVLSGMALYCHLRGHHPNDKPYCCNDCNARYNNLKELSSQRSNVHWKKSVKCSKCAYEAVSCAKMCQHVQRHTQGMLFRQCGKRFLMMTELARHEHLHDEHEEFECMQCGAVYYTSASLHIQLWENMARTMNVKSVEKDLTPQVSVQDTIINVD